MVKKNPNPNIFLKLSCLDVVTELASDNLLTVQMRRNLPLRFTLFWSAVLGTLPKTPNKHKKILKQKFVTCTVSHFLKSSVLFLLLNESCISQGKRVSKTLHPDKRILKSSRYAISYTRSQIPDNAMWNPNLTVKYVTKHLFSAGIRKV